MHPRADEQKFLERLTKRRDATPTQGVYLPAWQRTPSNPSTDHFLWLQQPVQEGNRVNDLLRGWTRILKRLQVTTQAGDRQSFQHSGK